MFTVPRIIHLESLKRLDNLKLVFFSDATRLVVEGPYHWIRDPIAAVGTFREPRSVSS
jgi:hypothetical protein